MEIYKDYIIESGGLGVVYVHKDYEGVTYIGEDMESRDRRSGSAYTVEQAKEEIDELEEDSEEAKAAAIREYNREPEINHDR